MKKLFLFFTLSLLIFASCKKKEEPRSGVHGHTPHHVLNGLKVYLQIMDSTFVPTAVVDSAIIAEDGFNFTNFCPAEPMFAMLKLENNSDMSLAPVPFIFEPGVITITLDSISKVSGTPQNKEFSAFYTRSDSIYKKFRKLYSEVKTTNDPEILKELSGRINAKEELYTEEMYEFVKKNASNQMGAWLMTENSYIFDFDQLNSVLADVDPKLLKLPVFEKMTKRLAALEATRMGALYTDLKAKSPDGKDISLSDYVGKNEYVLIDFWASWCPPCRADMPNLAKVYNKYKNKGFTIVGVSIDSDKAAWEKGIATLNITWPQMSTLENPSPLKDVYGVGGIPHTVLIDRRGSILARGLHGIQLMDEMDKRLK